MFRLVFLVYFIRCCLSDWSAFGGDSSHSGYKPVTLGDKLNPSLLWNVSLEISLTYGVTSGDVYATVGGGMNLFVLSIENGSQVESIYIGGGYYTGPPSIDTYSSSVFIQQIGGNEGIYLYQ